MTAKKGGGRPIGKRVKTAAEIVERLGGRCTAGQVNEWMPDAGICNVHKYLRRATAYGLMRSYSSQPMEFAVVDNWRRFLREVPEPVRAAGRRVSSVFDLASQGAQA